MKTRRPRVVLGVTSSGSLGLMKGLPEHLTGRGWEVHVVSSPGLALERLGATGDIQTHRIRMKRQPSLIADLFALLRWVRELLHIKPRAVMIGTPKAALLGLLAARLTRTPTRIYHLRGLRLETSRGLPRRVYTALERATFGASTSALAVSESLRRRVVRLGLVSGDRVSVLGRGSSNGVDTEHFVPSDPRTAAELRERLLGDADQGYPLIGFVGRGTTDKGIQDLVEASYALHGRGIHHQLLIVGPIEEARVSDILDDPSRHGTVPIVIGSVADTAPYYHVMDLLCLPTYREGFPNVILEAAASGIPVVTTDATGAVDSVIHGTTGFVAGVGDAKRLSELLERIVQNPTLKMDLGRNARQFAEDFYSRPCVHKQICQYLDHAAG